MSTELVVLSNHLIFCCPLLLLSSVFPSFRVFSNVSALCNKWPKYWSFSFNISPFNEYSGLISFRIDWSSCCPRDSQESFSSTTMWKHQFFGAQPSLWSNSHVHTWLLERPCCCCCQVTSVMSNSVWPHRWQPTRLPFLGFSSKNTGVGCHFLLQCMKVKNESEVAQSCPTLRDPMDYSLPGSSIHGIFQARVLEWGAIAFSRKDHSFDYKLLLRRLNK